MKLRAWDKHTSRSWPDLQGMKCSEWIAHPELSSRETPPEHVQSPGMLTVLSSSALKRVKISGSQKGARCVESCSLRLLPSVQLHELFAGWIGPNHFLSALQGRNHPSSKTLQGPGLSF